MTLVRGLSRDAQCLGHLGPGPAIGDGLVDRRVLQPIGQPPQRDDGRPGLGRIVWHRKFSQRSHASTVVDNDEDVNPS